MAFGAEFKRAAYVATFLALHGNLQEDALGRPVQPGIVEREASQPYHGGIRSGIRKINPPVRCMVGIEGHPDQSFFEACEYVYFGEGFGAGRLRIVHFYGAAPLDEKYAAVVEHIQFHRLEESLVQNHFRKPVSGGAGGRIRAMARACGPRKQNDPCQRQYTCCSAHYAKTGIFERNRE